MSDAEDNVIPIGAAAGGSAGRRKRPTEKASEEEEKIDLEERDAREAEVMAEGGIPCRPGKHETLFNVQSITEGIRLNLIGQESKGHCLYQDAQGHLCRIIAGGRSGTASIEVIGAPAQMLMELAYSDVKPVEVWWDKKKSSWSVRGYVPDDRDLKAVLAGTRWGSLLRIRRIVSQPIFRPNYTILRDNGYDSQSECYVDIADDWGQMPFEPSTSDVREALGYLWGTVLWDFPWRSDVDKANALGFLISCIMHPIFAKGDVLIPGFLFNANGPGSAKSALCKDIPEAIFGFSVMNNSKFKNDEELRKLITSELLSGERSGSVFDNLTSRSDISSGLLASLLTSLTWGDRMLQKNLKLNFHSVRHWVFNGNGIELNGDMRSRIVPVEFQFSGTSVSRDIEEFRWGNITERVNDRAEMRKLWLALATLVRGWAVAGAVLGSETEIRSNFRQWSRMVGGVLEFCGVQGFLENIRETSLGTGDGTASWLEALREVLEAKGGDKSLTVQEVILCGVDPPTKGRWPAEDPPLYGWQMSQFKGEFFGDYVLLNKTRGKNINHWTVLNALEHKAWATGGGNPWDYFGCA